MLAHPCIVGQLVKRGEGHLQTFCPRGPGVGETLTHGLWYQSSLLQLGGNGFINTPRLTTNPLV
jgi:hypothetical protein